MQRVLTSRTALAVLAVALLVPLALPGVAAVQGNDGDDDDAATAGSSETEPPRNRTLEIRLVHNDTGEAVADLSVEVMNRWRADRTDGHDEWSLRTDANGAIALNASDGPVRVAVDHPDWERLRASFRLDGNLSLELALRPASEDLARLSGTVRSAGGGVLPNATVEVDPARDCEREPCVVRRDAEGTAAEMTVDGTEVHLRWRPHDGHAYVDAADDGSFEVAVPAGSYRLEADAPDHLRAEHRVEVGANETAETDVELTPVPPDSVTLRGTVRDAETGEPVPGALVTVENPRWGSHDRARAGEDGAYSVTTKPGHLVVEVRADPGARPCPVVYNAEPRDGHDGEAAADTVEAQPSCPDHEEPPVPYLPRALGLSVEADETRNLSLELQPEAEPTATIQGWALEDGTGEPLPNATVHLRNEETDDWGRVQVDENGSFSARVPAGYHTVRVRAPGHLENATNVDVEADGTAEVVLRAPPGEPARGGACCYATPHREPVEASSEVHEGEAGGDGAAGGAGGGVPGSGDGPATITGGPGDLGRYQASSGPGEPDGAAIPSPGAALTAAVLLAAAVGASLRRPRSP